MRAAGLRRTLTSAVLLVAMLGTASCSGSSDGGGRGTSTSSTTTPAPSSSSSSSSGTGGTTPAGTLASPLGAKWNWNNFPAAQPYLRQLGGGSTYFEVVLCNIEKSAGQFDWAKTDSIINRAKQIGYTTLIKIRVGRCWATGGTAQQRRGAANITESAMPLSMSTYTDFVQQVVRRYSPSGADEYAVENEINSPGFWAGTPARYATLARAAASAIHAANPKALVVDPAISSAAAGYSVVDALLQGGQSAQALAVYNLYYARRFGTRSGAQAINPVSDVAGLRSVLGAPVAVKSLAFMAADNALLKDKVFQVRQVHFYEQYSALPYLLAYYRANTPSGVPLELWELGSYLQNSTLTPAQRSAETVKATVLALGEGVTKVVWLPLAADPHGRVANALFGLVSIAGQAQPSGSAFAAIAAAAKDAKVVGIDHGGVLGAGFERKGSTAVFAWSSSGSKSVTAPSALKVSSLTAASTTSTTSVSSGAKVQVTPDPLQLSVTGSAGALVKALG